MKRNKLVGLFYTAPGGELKLRRFAVVAFIFIVLMIAAIVFVIFQRADANVHMATVATIPNETSPTPSQGSTQTPETCPSDPGEWQFVGSGIPRDSLERIEPACVYDNLDRTVAWILAIREGYSRDDATQVLGFSQPPAQMNMSAIKVIDPAGNPLIASLVMVPLTAGYSEWYIDSNNAPAVDYIPEGCFSDIDMVGNETQTWNGSYPIICYIVEDNMATHTVMSLGGHVFSTSSSPTRSYLYFGYDPELKQWDWLGIDKALHSSTDVATMTNEQNNYSGQYGGSVWSAQWLSQTYNLTMKTLPDGWQTANDPEEFQAILNSINSLNTP